MPTYRNDTNGRITHQDKNKLAWEPGQVRELHFFVPHVELGLTLVDEKPYVLRGRTRGFGHEEFVITPGERRVWRIPYNETVEISVYALHGAVRVWFGDCEVPIIVDPNNNHLGRHAWDMTACLTFEGIEETDVYVTSMPFTEKGV